MTETKKGGVDFDDPTGEVFDTGSFSGEIEAGSWTQLEEVEGVRFRTWKFKDVDEEEVDGALVEIQPGKRTPVQFVESDHVFSENFQKGKFLVIYVDSEGDLSVYKYDSSLEEVSFSLWAKQGEIMCLYACKDNQQPAEVVECETPGFKSANLRTVEFGSTEIGGRLIPPELWKVIKCLDSGQEDNLAVEVVDLGEEIGKD